MYMMRSLRHIKSILIASEFILLSRIRSFSICFVLYDSCEIICACIVKILCIDVYAFTAFRSFDVKTYKMKILKVPFSIHSSHSHLSSSFAPCTFIMHPFSRASLLGIFFLCTFARSVFYKHQLVCSFYLSVYTCTYSQREYFILFQYMKLAFKTRLSVKVFLL